MNLLYFINYNNCKSFIDCKNLIISIRSSLYRHFRFVVLVTICIITLHSLSRRELGFYISNEDIIRTHNDVISDENKSGVTIDVILPNIDIVLNSSNDNATITNQSSNVSNSSNDTTITRTTKNTKKQTKTITMLKKSSNDNNESSPIQLLSSVNKTLVIIIGSLRGGELAWQSLYKQVLDVNYADLALLVGTKNGDSNIYPNNSTLYDRAKYHWEFKEPIGDWKNALFDMFNDMKADDPSLHDIDLVNRFRLLQRLSQNHTGLFGPIEGKRGSGAIIFILRHWLTKKIKELNLVNVYDRFVITRSDHYYMCTHNLSMLSNGKVWVPNGIGYGGITDRHVVVNNRNVLKALDIYPTLFRNATPFISEIRTMAPERLIDAVWRQNRLLPTHFGKFPRIMFTCGTTGDETRWKKYGGIVTVDNNNTVRLKYEKEYNLTSRNCKK